MSETQAAAESAPRTKRPQNRTNLDARIYKTGKLPKRKNKRSMQLFDLIQDGQTVRDYVESGGTMWEVWYDNKAGFIRLEEPTPHN